MALSTTQAIWRSGGGDQTRTAYCGSGVMAAQFYIADASPATAGTNVAVSSVSGAPALVLPEGAVVLSVTMVTETGSGKVDLGVTNYNTGVASNSFLATGIDVAVATYQIGSGLSGATVPALSYLTVTDGGSATGEITGYITYFVVDPLAGQQNV